MAVLTNDRYWGGANDISDLPVGFVERLQHYFTTYKMVPGEGNVLSVEQVYGRDQALEVVSAALEDYDEEYGR